MQQSAPNRLPTSNNTAFINSQSMYGRIWRRARRDGWRDLDVQFIEVLLWDVLMIQ